MSLRVIIKLGVGAGLLLLSSFSSAPPAPVEPRAYVLGAAKDYMGRSRIRVAGKWQMPDEVDVFHDKEQPLLDYITQLLETSNYSYSVVRNDQKNCGNCHEFQFLKSERLAREINDCYSFRFDSKGWDEQERVERVYVGRLTRPRLHDRGSKLSFLAGAYARYGSHMDSVFTIRLGNSLSKYKVVVAQLKALQCRIISDKITEGVPYVYEVRFVPTAELRTYLDEQNVIIDSIATRRSRTK